MSDEQYTQLSNQHADAHSSYWQKHNTTIELDRFRDGFRRGWDAAKQDYKKNNGELDETKLKWWQGEHLKANPEKDTNKPLVWEFEHGYKEGYAAWGKVGA